MLAVDPIQITEDVTVPRRDSDVTAWVNVIFGCNERCTYCVVPNTRGREQSRDPDAIKVNPDFSPILVHIALHEISKLVQSLPFLCSDVEQAESPSLSVVCRLCVDH